MLPVPLVRRLPRKGCRGRDSPWAIPISESDFANDSRHGTPLDSRMMAHRETGLSDHLPAEVASRISVRRHLEAYQTGRALTCICPRVALMVHQSGQD